MISTSIPVSTEFTFDCWLLSSLHTKEMHLVLSILITIKLRQRLLETCKTIADFAIFSGFGWHRKGDPLKSEKNILAKVAIFGIGNFFVFRLRPIF